jgi:thiol-disulfide isomerase/thioredoxin
MKRANIAPELSDIKGWINSDPLSNAGLRGKVVFLDFWTFGCINCINTRPHFNAMYEHFRVDTNFAMIGVHTPEFAYEKDQDSVRKAVLEHHIKYPVALDSLNTTWKLYGNHYWPRQAIIDAEGRIRYEHVGEGDYNEMEDLVSKLLEDARIRANPVFASR